MKTTTVAFCMLGLLSFSLAHAARDLTSGKILQLLQCLVCMVFAVQCGAVVATQLYKMAVTADGRPTVL